MTDDQMPPASPLAAALRGLSRAAASSDGSNDRGALADATLVHADRLDRDDLLKLVHMLTVIVALSYQSIDQLTGALERATGTGSWERIAAALSRGEPQ